MRILTNNQKFSWSNRLSRCRRIWSLRISSIHPLKTFEGCMDDMKFTSGYIFISRRSCILDVRKRTKKKELLQKKGVWFLVWSNKTEGPSMKYKKRQSFHIDNYSNKDNDKLEDYSNKIITNIIRSQQPNKIIYFINIGEALNWRYCFIYNASKFTTCHETTSLVIWLRNFIVGLKVRNFYHG